MQIKEWYTISLTPTPKSCHTRLRMHIYKGKLMSLAQSNLGGGGGGGVHQRTFEALSFPSHSTPEQEN